MLGKLIIFSAPSGAGKSTLVKHVLEQDFNLEFSVSATSRAPRGNEQHGEAYYFISADEFREKIENNEFAEYEQVYDGIFYGTLKSEIERITSQGKNIILDIDVIGGLNIKKQYGNRALAIFITPPSVEVLEYRLRRRATDSAEKIAERINKAEYELTFATQFDKVIINDKLKHAQQETENVIREFLHQAPSNSPEGGELGEVQKRDGCQKPQSASPSKNNFPFSFPCGESPEGERGLERDLGRGAYTQTIEYLYARLPVFQHIGGKAYKPGLDNTIKLLNALKNPQNLYKTIHIAGTNGKGSVSHILAAVLQEAGYKVGLYTSPHLVDFGERIRVNGEKIAQNYVVDFVEAQKPLFDEVQPSFFEATMAMAFAYFADEKVDVAVIETGMGGRLDSTNILRPELSVITNISFDHMEFLGNTLAKIAGEKAGIIKPNTPVVIGETVPESRAVFLQKAEEMNAPITFSEEKLQIISSHYENEKLHFTTSENKSYALGLTGNYQLKNAVTSLVSIEQLQKIGFHVSEENIKSGFANVVEITNLQGRWQKVGENPKIVLDTGHNVAGIENIVRQLREQKYKTLRIVIGMANDKDVDSTLSLLPKNAVYYFTQAEIKRALPAVELQEQAVSAGLNGKSFACVKSAIETAVSEADADDFIFVGGSNFVVGEALEKFKV